MDITQESLDLLQHRIFELESQIRLQQLQHRQELNQYEERIFRLEVDLASERTKTSAIQQKCDGLKQKLSSMPAIPRKTLSELGKSQFAVRKREIEAQLGPDYQIAKVNTAPPTSRLFYLAFQRIYHLPNRTIQALSKLPNSSWPTLKQLSLTEDKLIADCGGFTQRTVESVNMIWVTEPANVFFKYLDNLLKTAWNNNIPDQLKVVVTGDKGLLLTAISTFLYYLN
jgi:hypothetical protein